ncbi:MAG TPA: hypothetical protein VEF33_00330, partial [Syntrophales bacterium]|nr:hypothetical protein [Syntrophales bacterium]
LRGEIEDVARHRIIKWLDPKPVPDAEQSLPGFIPQGKGKHTPQMVHTVGTPLAVGLQDHLGVGSSDELLLPQFGPQLEEIINLTVKGDPVAPLIPHRLIPGDQIDDAQAPMGESPESPGMFPDPFAVRPAVALQIVHHRQMPAQVGYALQREINCACYAAHVNLLFPFSSRPGRSKTNTGKCPQEPLPIGERVVRRAR